MCIRPDWMCDGKPHCHDESDESPATCNPEEFTTQMMEASTNSSTEDQPSRETEEQSRYQTTSSMHHSNDTDSQPKRETEEQSRYQTTSPMHHSNDTDSDESGIETSSVSVSVGGVLLGKNDDDLQQIMNSG
ncbi:uncharacterized protein LOC134705835 [Mytilus trossulus]|uniref:uncharacterized protein LOC134705835 n=1 Tax=Mytilus trossulus TaxID=6551 RepID=UPI0030053DD3